MLGKEMHDEETAFGSYIRCHELNTHDRCIYFTC